MTHPDPDYVEHIAGRLDDDDERIGYERSRNEDLGLEGGWVSHQDMVDALAADQLEREVWERCRHDGHIPIIEEVWIWPDRDGRVEICERCGEQLSGVEMLS
jgi:hypothetical protein